MSSIYIQEPPTFGKVLLKTSVGDIDIELWAKETPKACRNFVQLCMEGYYDGLIFHRLIKGFIVQGGDPNGNGSGGESIYGEMFKDEFHSRLRYTRRGLVAMANAGKNDNGSQFFFTLGATPELQNKHTLFGKVTGDTLYNMLKLEDGLVGEDERPLYPHKILKTEILSNPFDDIIPRRTNELTQKAKKRDKKKEKGVKNFTLLSFGNEAEDDEIETTEVTKKFQSKAKSSHDVLDDPKLSRETFKAIQGNSVIKSDDYIEEYEDREEEETPEEKAKRIRDKLQSKTKRKLERKSVEEDSGSDDDYLILDIEQERQTEKKKKKMQEIKNEISSLKKQYREEEKEKTTRLEKVRQEEETKTEKSELFKEYLDEKDKYKKLKELPKKGSSREDFTLNLLKQFRDKLEKVKQDGPNESNKDDDDEGLNNGNWLSHKLEFSEQGAVLAKDATTKKDDWYDVYDPRNPLNQRRRGESSKSSRRDKK